MYSDLWSAGKNRRENTHLEYRGFASFCEFLQVFCHFSLWWLFALPSFTGLFKFLSLFFLLNLHTLHHLLVASLALFVRRRLLSITQNISCFVLFLQLEGSIIRHAVQLNIQRSKEMFQSELTINLDFFRCEQRGVTGADWSHLLHRNRWQVRYNFDLRNVLQTEGNVNVLACYMFKLSAGIYNLFLFYFSAIALFADNMCEVMAWNNLLCLWILVSAHSHFYIFQKKSSTSIFSANLATFSQCCQAKLTGLGVKWKLERASNLRKSVSISFWISTWAGFSFSSVFCWNKKK